MLTVGSLFSGIGGLDVGLERAGMTVRWQSEIDPYACRVLAKHWPGVPNLGDISTIDWSTVEPVDLICGGYPCQPFSLAGARAGEHDARHLWPYFAAAIRQLRPRYALLENVPGHLSLGFGRVLGDLAEVGYDAEWCCVSAGAVGAPHLRIRVFIVAHAVGDAVRVESAGLAGSLRAALARHDGAAWELADADNGGRDRRTRPVGARRWGQPADGGWWAVEPDVGRVAHGVPRRVDRLRTLGNAVVPQVAEWVGRRIVSLDEAA